MRIARAACVFALGAATATGEAAGAAAVPQAAASPGPAVAASPAPTHCLDSFLAVGQPLARPLDIAQERVTNPKPDYVIRTDMLVAPAVPGAPLVGFLYITRENNAFFSTRPRKNIDAAAEPLIREIYAASTTATAAELNTLLAHQDGNAVVYLPRALRLLRSLQLRAARCVVLAKKRSSR